MHFVSLERLNEALARDPRAAILEAEAAFADKILKTARKIEKNSSEKPIVLLTGPSGSGKTTAALMIENYLDSTGHETHTISLDNYFHDRTNGNLPVDEEGNIDFESPLHLDAELLAKHMLAIERCEPIEIPTFDFPTQKRTDKTVRLHRKPGELVIFEGIHALNPLVTGGRKSATGIYISVRTRVLCGDDVLLHPSLIRLMRRLLRDKNHRGQSFEDTINRLKSVTRGERLFIDPFKRNAEEEIDSFCPYEISAYRDLILPELSSLSEYFLREKGVYDLLTVLRAAQPLDLKAVPERALIHEFLS